jgi:hypothetical protein
MVTILEKNGFASARQIFHKIAKENQKSVFPELTEKNLCSAKTDRVRDAVRPRKANLFLQLNLICWRYAS